MGKGGFNVSFGFRASYGFLILVGILILGGLYVMNQLQPVHGQFVIGLWEDKNGNGQIDSGEIMEQKLDMNPYSMVPMQAMIDPHGKEVAYFIATVRYKLSRPINNPFYGAYAVYARGVDGTWYGEWITPSWATYSGGNIKPKNLQTGSTEEWPKTPVFFSEGLQFSYAKNPGEYTSGAVFPYNVYPYAGGWKSKVLPASDGIFTKIYHSNHGTNNYLSHNLERWLKNKGGSQGGTYELSFYFTYIKKAGGTLRDEDFLAQPVKAPFKLKVKLGSSLPLQIIALNVNYATMMAVPVQAAGFEGIVLVNPYVIAAALLIAVGVLMYMRGDKRRRRR